MKKFFYLLAGVLVLQSMTCEPDITFYEPQPDGIASLKTIPKNISGNYKCMDDPSLLEVDKSRIIVTTDHDHAMHQNELDSSMVISGENITDLETGEEFPFTVKGDSLLVHIHDVDTLFDIGKGHLIKKYKNDWFLNISHDTEKWEVVKLELNKNQLVLSKIDKDLELQMLVDITHQVQDTVPPYRFHASKAQFSKFVKGNGFKDRKVYVKQ